MEKCSVRCEGIVNPMNSQVVVFITDGGDEYEFGFEGKPFLEAPSVNAQMKMLRVLLELMYSKMQKHQFWENWCNRAPALTMVAQMVMMMTCRNHERVPTAAGYIARDFLLEKMAKAQ